MRKINIIICIVIVIVLSVVMTPVATSADESINSESELDYEKEADSWRFKNGHIIEEENNLGIQSRIAYEPWSKVNGGFINSRGEIIEGAIRKGIDVSVFQGNIDWQKVKNSGIDFAIIRCGYGSDFTEQDDSKWQRNVSECERLGIPYGVYLYSYANTTAKARSEAQHVLRLLKGHTPTYPVYYDLEDKTVADAGKAAIINYADIFCSTIEANGYKAGIYASLGWWNDILNDARLSKYEKWVAQWYSECTYKGDYRLWQCTSDGTVPGISGRVDLNFEFFRKDTIIDVVDYNIIINAEYKNCRKGPDLSYAIEGDVLKRGEETKITHEANGWGKMEDGRWVNLYGTIRK